METTKIALFKGQKIRKTIYNNEWWFSVVDVVEVLTDSNNPRVYWNAMKSRVKSDDGFQLSTICRQLKLSNSSALGSAASFRMCHNDKNTVIARSDSDEAI